MFKSSAHAEGLSGEGELWRVGCNASTSLKQLVVLGLGDAGKQGNAFINFGKKRSSLNAMEVAM